MGQCNLNYFQVFDFEFEARKVLDFMANHPLFDTQVKVIQELLCL